MAIAVRSVSASATADIATSPVAIATASPTGKTVGDLLILCGTARGDGPGPLILTTGSTGWTAISGASAKSGATNITNNWYRIADGSINDTPIVSSTNSNDQETAYIMYAITGFQSSPIIDTASAYAPSASTSASTTIPAVTTTVAGELQIAVLSTYMTTPAATTITLPSGWTLSASVATTTGNRGGLQAGIHRTLTTASSYASVTLVHTGTTNAQTMTNLVIFPSTSPIVQTAKIGWGLVIR